MEDIGSQIMKGIKDIIVKGTVFAVLSAVFCAGGAGGGLETVRADVDNTTLEYFRPEVDGNGKVTPITRQGIGVHNRIPEKIEFAGMDWYVIGYDGTGVAAEPGMITLLNTDVGKYNTSFGSNNSYSYAGSNVASSLEDQYIAFPEDVKGAIVPRTLTSVSDNIAGEDITAGLWALSKSEAEKLNEVLQVDCSWWLRTPDDLGGVYFVWMKINSTDEKISSAGVNDIIKKYIRPALRVRADSVVYNVVGNTGSTYSYSLTPGPALLGDRVYATLQGAVDAAKAGDTVKLLTDVEIDSMLKIGEKITLDLNGHTIDGSGIETEPKTVIKILSDGNLTLDDSSEAKTGLITGGSLTDGSGGGVYANGNFTMNGGTISGNSAGFYGGGVFVTGGIFTMNGGKICSNTAGKSGGGVGLLDTNPVTFEMNGGTICNNEGGGVFFKKENDQQPSESSFILTGGTIKDNRLKNGTIRNVCLRNGKHIIIPEELKENTSIGVTTDPLPTSGSQVTITDGWKTHMSSKDPSLYFKSDDPGSAPVLNADGEAELVTAYKVTVNNGTGSGSYAEGAGVTIKAEEPASGKRFKEWICSDALTFTSGSKTTPEATFTMPAKAVTVEATYEDMEKVKAPLFDPNSGTYTSAQNVTISSETPGADIYYTVDGSAPTENSTKYTGPVSVTKTMTIKAIAVKADMLDSNESSATYTISSEPSVTTYAVTVENGTGSGEYAAGATVTITADAPADGKVFDRWTSTNGVTFADAALPETTFRMPGHDVAVIATYKDKEQTPEKVPVSDPTSSYASPEDNFAPVAPGSSEGTGGSIKKLELDFSKVKGSGVATDSLKMTAVAGSKFTTKEKVKDKSSVTTEGGVKAKFNKKDSTVTISCKSTGKAIFNMEDGDSYTVNFTVDKPKPNKNEAKLSTGTAPVTKTVKDLFGTSINGGKLTILKEKVSGQAAVKDNELTVNPAEKDTIKLQYQYLNKKYKLSIKVK